MESDPMSDIRLLSPESMACPFPNYAALQKRDAAHEEPGVGYVLTRLEDCVSLADNTEAFSNHWHGLDQGMTMMGQSAEPYSPEVEQLVSSYPYQMPNGLLLADAPIHTRHRALVLKALNARRVREFEPNIHEIVNFLIDEFIDDGRTEFMHAFGELLPSYVSAEILGIDREDVPAYSAWTELFIQGFVEPVDNERRAIIAQGVIDFQSKTLELIEARRQRRTDDLLSDLVYAEIQDGEQLDGIQLQGPARMNNAELLSILILLFTGGSHTTMGLLGNSMRMLCERPDIQAELRADPTMIPRFLEEMLRFESPVQNTVRLAKSDGCHYGHNLKRGDRVAPVWGAANQDPARFDHPREFDMHRDHVRRHLAFGQGPHFCVGAALARAEGKIGFETLLRRLADIRFAPDDGAGGLPCQYIPSMSIRMHKYLHIEFDKT